MEIDRNGYEATLSRISKSAEVSTGAPTFHFPSKVELLEKEVIVRSAERLAWERPGTADRWTGAWLPVVRGLLDEA